MAEVQGEKIAAMWTKRLEEADALIRSGKGKKAEKITKLLARDMMDKILFGESASQWLGTANLLRALSVGVQDRPDEALWYWHTAQQLYPAIANYELSEYGEVGRLFMDSPLRSESLAALPNSGELEAKGGAFDPPKAIFAPIAVYPYAQRETRTEPKIRVECKLDENGKLSHPLIVGEERRVPFVFTALDQLFTWKVEPAKLDGEPLAVLHQLVVEVR